jgi:hypothetical protein
MTNPKVTRSILDRLYAHKANSGWMLAGVVSRIIWSLMTQIGRRISPAASKVYAHKVSAPSALYGA